MSSLPWLRRSAVIDEARMPMPAEVPMSKPAPVCVF